MADFGTPVAGQQPPQSGLATLQSLMSLKSQAQAQQLQQQALQSGQIGISQQQQNLQTGQSTQQSAQAKAIQDQQVAKETQAGASLLADPVGNGILDASGQPASNAYQKVLQAMPTTGASHYNDLVSAAKTSVDYKKSYTGLRTDQQSIVSSRLAGIAADPKSNLSDIYDGLNAIRATYKGTAAEGDINTLTDSAKTAVDKVAGQNGLPGAKQVIMGLSRGGIGNAGITGAGGVATPQPGTMDSGGQILPGAQAPALEGGAFTPAGAPIAKVLTPAERLPHQISTPGGVRNVTPGGTMSVPGEAGSAPPGGLGINPSAPQGAAATGVAGSNVDRANEVANLQQQSSAAIPLTKRIDELSHEIGSGHLAKMISESGNYLGFSSINEARSQLNKDLGQVKGLAVSKAGSDSRAATILEGYPTDTTPESTVHAAMDYIRGTARQNLARGQLLSQYQKSDPQGLQGFQAADNIVSGQTNPLMHEYQSLKTPQDQAGFFKRNFSSRAEASSFRDQVEALKKHTSVLGQ
jgi:hypothetical protein